MKTAVLITVGTSELPCLIAAHRLWEFFQSVDNAPPDIWIIHSSDTKKESESVKKALEKKLNREFSSTEWRMIPVHPRDPESIQNEVSSRLLVKKYDRIHFHYTGGTSAMAVHTSKAIANLDVRVESSYLDIAENRIKSFDWPDPTHRMFPKDERFKWSLTLKDLATIHRCDVCPNQITTEADRSIALTYEALFSADGLDVKALFQLKDRDPNHRGFEEFVANQLRKALKDAGFDYPVEVDQKLKPNIVKNEKDATAQLDVCCVIGYQLILLSCTVSHDSTSNKLKGMEAWFRANQLGGMGAFAGLVGLTNPDKPEHDTNHLRRSLHFDFGVPDGTAMQVWGRDDIYNLKDDLLKVILKKRS